jgi:metal-responsive CopG/Arc/MetJ family transcriptional regulator
MPNINIYLNPVLNKELEEIAKKSKTSKSDIIYTIVQENVENYKK